MTYTFTEKREERVLAWVNRMRAEHKIGRPLKRLPRGRVGKTEDCPLARALRKRGWCVEVTPGQIDWEQWGPQAYFFWETPPKYINEFVEAFDEGACSRLRKLAVES